MFLYADSEEPDQSGWKGHFVGFAMRRLKYAIQILTSSKTEA